MLGRIAAAIRAVLAAMPRYLVKKILEAGVWVSRLVAEPAPPPPVISAEPAAQVAETESMIALRNAANAMAQGFVLTPAQAEAIAPLQADWLRSMTRQEICQVILAKDDDIRRHMRGIAPIRGVVPYDREAIADVTKARKDRPAPKPARRTVAQVLAEREAAQRGQVFAA